MARKYRVSLVDDDESCRESLVVLLQVLGYEVRAFASVAELVSGRAGLECDCLLLDATTEGATDPELLDRLKHPRARLPFIFVTGYAGEELQRDLLACGASGCLQKPFEDDALVGAIERAAGATAPG